MKILFIFTLFCLSLLLPVYGQAQLVSVSGYVRNQSTGEIKRNATVFESVSGVGTITNHEGHYRLLLSSGPKKIEISSTGFNSFTASFNLVADTIISAELVPLNFSQEKADGTKQQKMEPFGASDTGVLTNNRSK